jgi:hypothetical protein
MNISYCNEIDNQININDFDSDLNYVLEIDLKIKKI